MVAGAEAAGEGRGSGYGSMEKETTTARKVLNEGSTLTRC